MSRRSWSIDEELFITYYINKIKLNSMSIYGAVKRLQSNGMDRSFESIRQKIKQRMNKKRPR